MDSRASKALAQVLGRLDSVHRIEAYRARCRAHLDRGESLAVWVGADGWVRLHCEAGCSVDDVLRSLSRVPWELAPYLGDADITVPSVSAA